MSELEGFKNRMSKTVLDLLKPNCKTSQRGVFISQQIERMPYRDITGQP